jgi:3(or 17)beta-hydroxysteroid dehydrogenase
MGRLEGKVAIVTGAAMGLGEADARLMAREGARVILTDVNERGAAVAAEIGESARFVRHDVRDEEGWKALMADVMAQEGRLDVLVNNAGVVEAGTIETTTAAQWRFVMDVSADGTFFGCKYAIPAMKASGGGSIINMASVASIAGHPAVTAYCAAKGAVEALTRAVAVHCTQTGLPIRCNSIHPGGIDTPMTQGIGGKMVDAGLIRLDADTPPPPAPVLGAPDDIAWTVVFLASDESRFISGQKLVVDNTVTVTPGIVAHRASAA